MSEFNELLKIANKGYQDAAQDGGVLRLIDEDGEPDTDGDSLARAIVTELREGVDYSGDFADTVQDAIHSMESHRDLLSGVINALENEHYRLTKS